MDDAYAVAQARRGSPLRLRSARTKNDETSRPSNAPAKPRRNTNATHQVLQGRICIRYEDDCEQSCPTEPAAQPSSCCTAPSWPRGGAACSRAGERRLCNPITENREWQNWISDGSFFFYNRHWVVMFRKP